MSPELLAELLRPAETTYRRFLVEWHGERLPAFGVPSGELPAWLPRVLLDFYEFAGRWPQAIGFNQLIDPQQLAVEDDLVVFCVENQGVVRWAVGPDGDDPPVLIEGSTMDDPEGAGGWRPEGERLSRFVLQLVLFEAMLDAPYGGVALAQPEESWRAIVAPLSPLPLAAWSWPASGTRLWAGDDVIAQVCPDPGSDTAEVHVGARSVRAAAYLGRMPDEIWDTLRLDDAADWE